MNNMTSASLSSQLQRFWVWVQCPSAFQGLWDTEQGLKNVCDSPTRTQPEAFVLRPLGTPKRKRFPLQTLRGLAAWRGS